MYVDNTNAIRKGLQTSVDVTADQVAEIRKQQEREAETRRVKTVLRVVFTIVAIVAAYLLAKYVIPKIISAVLKIPPVPIGKEWTSGTPPLNTLSVGERIAEQSAPAISSTVQTVEQVVLGGKATLPPIAAPPAVAPAVSIAERIAIGVKPNLPALPQYTAVKAADAMHNFTVTSAVGTELVPLSQSSNTWTALPSVSPLQKIVNVMLPVLSTIGTILLAL